MHKFILAPLRLRVSWAAAYADNGVTQNLHIGKIQEPTR
jgi:hypothetical protein